MNNLRFIRGLIYTLKKRYGYPTIIYRITAKTLNLETGIKRRTTRFRKIQKVVLLPIDIQRMFAAAVDNLAITGGSFDPKDRIFLIDQNDLSDFNIEIDDYLIYDGLSYLIHEIEEYVGAYFLKTRAITGATVADVDNPVTTNNAAFSQIASYELNP